MENFETGTFYIDGSEPGLRNPFKKLIPFFISGIIGIVAFIMLLNDFVPYKAFDISITRTEAIDIASKFLKEQGYMLDDYYTQAFISFDLNTAEYIQKKLGWKQSIRTFRDSIHKGLNPYWRVMWYKNLPQSTPYRRYWVNISGSGKILAFSQFLPENAKSQSKNNPHLDQSKALEIALEFFKKFNININDGYQQESFVTQKLTYYTEHYFSWTKKLDFEKGKVQLFVLIQGDKVGVFVNTFGIPESQAAALNKASGRIAQGNILAYAFIFITWLIIQFIFLKKYHEGEAGVKNSVIFFFIIWGTLVAESLLKFKINGIMLKVVPLSQLSFNGSSWAVAVLFILILWPFFSIKGFSAWSVGEALGREKFGNKFISIDSLFNGKFSSLNTAISMTQGFMAGFIGLGCIAFLLTFSILLLNGWTAEMNYRILSIPFPYFLPFLLAVSTSLLSELVCRLFCNLILYKYLKNKWIGIFISSLFWTAFAWVFWEIAIKTGPSYFHLIFLYLIGLYFSFLFWKFDFLTVIVANYTIVGIMNAIPLITSSSTTHSTAGIISIVILFFPVLFIIRGFIKREVFNVEHDLVPAHIRRITERVRMGKELEIARQVQQKLLPSRSPEIEGFEINGTCIPANEVGGDYYDFIPIDENRLGIVIGDVSGKGVPAAIYMTLTKGIIYSQVENRLSPEEVLVKLNRSLYTMMDQKSFVTLFIGVLDFKNRTLRYSRAGHNPLLYFRCSDNCIISLKPGGIAVGIEKGRIFNQSIKEEVLELMKGDLFVFYTDGFSEARNKDLDEYGEKRLIEVIGRCKEKPVKEIIDMVIEDVKLFTRGYPQHDDMTIVVVKVF